MSTLTNEVRGSRDDSDAFLARQCAAGSESAFEEIFKRHSGRVLAVAARIVGDRDEAMDVLQEVFVKIHRRIGQFRCQSAFSLWIYRIAVHESLNWAQRRRSKVRPLPDAERVAAPQEAPEEATAMAALQALPPKLRAVAVLRHVQEMSHEEIAQVLGVPVGTARSRLFAAHRRMREALREQRSRERSES